MTRNPEQHNGETPANTPEPTPGQVWQEKHSGRTVEIVHADPPDHNGFIYTRTLTRADGKPPSREVRSRIRRTFWHSSWTPADSRQTETDRQ